MSPGALDPLLHGAGVALTAAAVATPAFWRATRGLPAVPRVAMTSLAGSGLACVASLLFLLERVGDAETVAATVFWSAMFQGLALPVLILLSRKF